MARVTSNFNTPPFKKFTLATLLNYNSARVHPALLCANHTEQGKYTGQDMQAARQKQKPGQLFIERAQGRNVDTALRSPCRRQPRSNTHSLLCREIQNGADAAVLQRVDQSVVDKDVKSRTLNIKHFNCI